MTSNGFFPKITFPTRFSNHNATLIDQIFHKSTTNNFTSKSAILWANISDHLACISGFKHIGLKPRTPRYVRTSKNEKISNFSLPIGIYLRLSSLLIS